MRMFKDGAGREWFIAINVTAMKRVKTMCELDLMQAVGGDVVQRLTDDLSLLADVLYSLCHDQCVANGVSDEQFGEGLAGDAIDAATGALLEELIDFFPKAKRTMLRKTMEKYQAMEEAATKKLTTELDNPMIEATMNRDIDRRLREVFGNSSTDAQESLESTPAP